MRGIPEIVQATRVFQQIHPKLASQAYDYRPGHVSDLVFNGFAASIVLLLPLATDRGEISWQTLVSRYNISEPGDGLTQKQFRKHGAEGVYYPAGQIPNDQYAAKLAHVLSEFNDGSAWIGIFWSGYAHQQGQASIVGPAESSFLRPEEYSVSRLPAERLGGMLQSQLPAVLFDDSASCVLTLPIYADPIYVSCERRLATVLAAEFDDVFPVSPADRLPDYRPYERCGNTRQSHIQRCST